MSCIIIFCEENGYTIREDDIEYICGYNHLHTHPQPLQLIMTTPLNASATLFGSPLFPMNSSTSSTLHRQGALSQAASRLAVAAICELGHEFWELVTTSMELDSSATPLSVLAIRRTFLTDSGGEYSRSSDRGGSTAPRFLRLPPRFDILSWRSPSSVGI